MKKRGGRVLPSAWRTLFVLPIWALSSWWLWSWWLNLSKVGLVWLYYPLTLAMLYEFMVLPLALLYFILRCKIPPKRIAPKNLKVAVITTCVPKMESLEVIERQLQALTRITYPHESWILDEGGNNNIKKLAKIYKVNYFSRHGQRRYNQPHPPFKAKTKAGNVNAWLKHVKRRNYDFFVQLDIDHIPKPNYLNKVLGHFRDPEVAWVQGPSIYNNLDHWTAKGAAEQELVFQGPLQMGFYGHSGTPFIIGSHSTYRMNMLREIGGFQPTRAEDHLDTMALSNKGYKGVYVPEIIAEGDGPETLQTYLAQQYAWAYSMFQILIHHSPSLLKGMPLKTKFQFLFAQTWYPIWSLSYLIMFVVPVIALLLNRVIINVDSWLFTIRYFAMIGSIILIWWAGRPLMQPKNLRLSWRALLLHAVRWPTVLRAIISAGLGIEKPYMITPKGKNKQVKASFRAYYQFLILTAIATLAVVTASWIYNYQLSVGQIVFVGFNVFIMMAIIIVDVVIKYKTAATAGHRSSLGGLKSVLITSAIGVLVVSSFAGAYTNYYVARAEISRASKLALKPASINYTMLTNELNKRQLHASETPTIGTYDPLGELDSTNKQIQHSFLDWSDIEGVEKQLYLARLKNNTPLITLEPRGEENGAKLLKQISVGYYTQNLQKIFYAIRNYGQPVYIRFAHEMDLGNIYPWGNQNPEDYINAFRYVVKSAEAMKANNIHWVWSPAGNNNASNYYPGDDVVDVVGATILYDKYWFGDYQPSFKEISKKRDWLQNYGKPVWIAEFGSGNDNPDYQSRLIQDATDNYQQYGYEALIYLNIPDANLNEPDRPDYTIVNKDHAKRALDNPQDN